MCYTVSVTEGFMKKILLIFAFVITCFFSFAEDDDFLPFIKDLLEGKIECTEEVFLEHGFVDLGEDCYITTWENHYLEISVFHTKNHINNNIIQIIIDSVQ